MTIGDHGADVAYGLMTDPAFATTVTLYVDTSPRDAYGNKTAATHTPISLTGFWVGASANKAIEAEGTEPKMSARFYTHDTTTVIKLKDKISYDDHTYGITGINTVDGAGKKMYRIIDMLLAEAAV
jgi:hypothetical protein